MPLRVALTLIVVLVAGLGIPAVALAQPADVDVYVAEAVLAIEDKQWDKALDLLKGVLARQPDHVEALYYTGVAYMGKGQPAQALPVLLRARQLSPAETSIALQLGLAYIALEQYDRATTILEEAFAKNPEHDSLGYHVGFLRYRASRYQDALNALQVARSADPAIANLTRIYTGLARQRLGLPPQAEADVSQIGQLRPAAPLTATAERLKGAVAPGPETARRFRAQLRAGVFYDDNAPAAPDRAEGDADVGALRRGKQRTTGEVLAVSLEYDWLRSGDWLGTAGFSFLGTHNNELPSFDIQDYTGTLRLSRTFTAFNTLMQAGFTYGYDYLVLDNDEFVQRHAMSGYLAIAENAPHLTLGQVRVEVKEYSEVRPLRSAEFPDAVNYLLGVIHFVRFDRDRHYIKAGYQADVDDARGRNFTYVGHRLLLGGQYTLPWRDIRLTYEADVHYRDYLHVHSILGRERRDLDYTQVFRVDVPLPWFTSSQAFLVSAEYINKIVDSNLNVFEYHRNFATLSFTWRY